MFFFLVAVLCMCPVLYCRLSLGDDRVPFCMQSCSKCMNYSFVLQDNGREEVRLVLNSSALPLLQIFTYLRAAKLAHVDFHLLFFPFLIFC